MTSETSTENQERQPAFSAAGLLDDLWHHLKALNGHCTESMAIALTPRSFDAIEGQRAMVRELQNWLLAHGYSSNKIAQPCRHKRHPN